MGYLNIFRLALGVLFVSLAFASSAVAEPFGVQSFEVSAVNRDGSPDVQAGSHPYALVTKFRVERTGRTGRSPQRWLFGPGGLKDVRVELPPGFVGNPNAVPRCSYMGFSWK